MKNSIYHSLKIFLAFAMMTASLPIHAATIMTFDSSGAPGAAANPGQGADYSQTPAAPPGTYGAQGGNSGVGTPGGNALPNSLTLSTGTPISTTQLGTLVITGTVGSSQVNQTLPLISDPTAFVYINSKGGPGANGGRGGMSQQSGQGTTGADASVLEPAGQGGNGLPGLQSGSGSIGRNGGNAADTIVNLHPQDTHLLMYLKVDTSGGVGGLAGYNPPGGYGGEAGPGGAGGTFTVQGETGEVAPQPVFINGVQQFNPATPEMIQVPDQIQATNPDDNSLEFEADGTTPVMIDDPSGATHQEQAQDSSGTLLYNDPTPVMTDQPVIGPVSLVRPDGVDGLAGPNGPQSNTAVSAGNPGNSAKYRIMEVTPTGTIEYDQRYELQVVGYQMAPNANGVDSQGKPIFEAGDTVTVTGIQVKNIGGMPTPAMNALFNLTNSNFMIAKSQALNIQGGILPSQTVTLPANFTFKINDPQLAGSSTSGATIVPTIMLAGRYFENADLQTTMTFRYPIKITQISSINPMNPNTSTLMTYTITNLSGQDIGSQSTLGRQALAQLSLAGGGGMDPTQIHFASNGGAAQAASAGALVMPIPLIKAGASATFSATVSVGNIVPGTLQTPTSGNLVLELHLQAPADPSTPTIAGAIRVIEQEFVSLAMQGQSLLHRIFGSSTPSQQQQAKPRATQADRDRQAGQQSHQRQRQVKYGGGFTCAGMFD